MRSLWPVPVCGLAAIWSIQSGNNAAFIVSLYLAVIWVGTRLHRSADRHVSPLPAAPTTHVRTVLVGTCAMCGREGVEVHELRPHVLLDAEPHCDGCANAAVTA